MTNTKQPAGPSVSGPAHHGVVGKLSTLDRLLPVWIVVGLLAGRWIPGLATGLDAVSEGGVSLPIAVGLLVMPRSAMTAPAT